MPSRLRSAPSVPGAHASAAFRIRRFSSTEKRRRWGRSGISEPRVDLGDRDAAPLTAVVSMTYRPLTPGSSQTLGAYWYRLILTRGGCADASKPKTNVSYWIPKLARNVERDAKHIKSLETMGFRVFVAWDCEISKDVGAVARRILSAAGA